MSTNPILQKMDDIGDAVIDMRKGYDKGMAEMRDRIETLESKGERPRHQPAASAEFKVFHTDHGECYELPGKTRLQDVPEFTKTQPQVSYERWLAAAMLGERCEDKVALEFAR